MAEQEQPKRDGWRERRRESRRLKLERTGDSPQKRTERTKKPGDPSVKDNAERAAGAPSFM